MLALFERDFESDYVDFNLNLLKICVQHIVQHLTSNYDDWHGFYGDLRARDVNWSCMQMLSACCFTGNQTKSIERHKPVSY